MAHAQAHTLKRKSTEFMCAYFHLSSPSNVRVTYLSSQPCKREEAFTSFAWIKETHLQSRFLYINLLKSENLFFFIRASEGFDDFVFPKFMSPNFMSTAAFCSQTCKS